MKINVHVITACFMMVFMAGCSGVVCEKPFGEPVSRNNLKKFEGDWHVREGIFPVALGKKSLITAGLDFEDERDQFVAVNASIVVTEYSGRTFYFMKPSLLDHYSIGLIEKATKDKVILRTADEKYFVDLVESGKANGKLPPKGFLKSIVHAAVEFSSQDLKGIIDSQPADKLFPPENSVIATRVSPPGRLQKQEERRQ